SGTSSARPSPAPSDSAAAAAAAPRWNPPADLQPRLPVRRDRRRPCPRVAGARAGDCASRLSLLCSWRVVPAPLKNLGHLGGDGGGVAIAPASLAARGSDPRALGPEKRQNLLRQGIDVVRAQQATLRLRFYQFAQA